MRRLTISQHACVETLGLLITMAWADGRLDDNEKAGLRGAAAMFNRTKELRDRLDVVLDKPTPLEQLRLDELAPREKAFAYVAAVWMSRVDGVTDEKEAQLLEKLAGMLGYSADMKKQLERVARELPPAEADRDWSGEVLALLKAIPPRLEGIEEDEAEVVFE